MQFSNRLPKDLSDSPFFKELEARKIQVESFIDMTVSAPMRVGLVADLKSAVENEQDKFLNWEQNAAGAFYARDAVAAYYNERGGNFSAEDILLFASTSEAYSVLFKTFCNVSDKILTPMPGYPLLDTLAALEQLETYPYFFKRISKRFVLDKDSLLSSPENAKILLLVTPHNPTGHCINESEWNAAVSFCEERDIALVVDEVFGDFIHDERVRRTWLFERSKTAKCPIFWLNGLSKTVGSPQLKLGWMLIHAPMGDKNAKSALFSALEFVEDAYLSVSSTAEALSKTLLKNAKSYENRVEERLQKNLKKLREYFPESANYPKVYGGWYAPLYIGSDDEKLTLSLLSKAHVLVQPGFFFDFEEDGWIVLSLLQETSIFAEGVFRIHKFLSEHTL